MTDAELDWAQSARAANKAMTRFIVPPPKLKIIGVGDAPADAGRKSSVQHQAQDFGNG
jgi:hypothetical protein